jgi:hypothetical protein
MSDVLEELEVEALENATAIAKVSPQFRRLIFNLTIAIEHQKSTAIGKNRHQTP